MRPGRAATWSLPSRTRPTTRSRPGRCLRRRYDDRAEPRVPPFVMDRPVLHAFVSELAEHERLAEFADALPARARVSEAALPVVLASLYEKLERPLVCLLPEDADARDAAEAAA